MQQIEIDALTKMLDLPARLLLEVSQRRHFFAYSCLHHQRWLATCVTFCWIRLKYRTWICTIATKYLIMLQVADVSTIAAVSTSATNLRFIVA